MAQVTVCVLGGQPRNIEAGNVGQVKERLGLANHTASVNGQPRNDNYELSDFQYVSLTAAVKGGK